MPGPVWPHGPAALPAVIELAGQRYTIAATPGMRLAYAIASGVMLVPELLTPSDNDAVHQRLNNPQDPLDWIHLERATVHAVAALTGIERGVNGWRAGLRLCQALLTDWPHSGGALMALGVSPDRAPLWEMCAALYWQFIDNPNAKDADIKQAKMRLFAPLEGEPEWMRPVVPPPPLPPAQAKAGAMALFQRVNGAPPAIPGRCQECQRLGAHTAECSQNPARGKAPAPCRECGRPTGHARGCPKAATRLPVRTGAGLTPTTGANGATNPGAPRQ